ncbi:MAG: hypothetical protein Q9212_002383 [Teloschistes hypoglaucus]
MAKRNLSNESLESSLIHSKMEAPPNRPKLTGRAFYESIGSPKYILAPMVDQSEFAWRLLTRSFLPSSQRPSLLAYTPMFHARLFQETKTFRDHHFQPSRTGLPSLAASKSSSASGDGENGQQSLSNEPPYLDGHPTHDRPLIVQFCSNSPQEFLSAATHVSPYCDAVDLNLGCPQGIARKGHYGSFLQESPDLIHSLISTLAENLHVPVTAKMRVLDTREDTLKYAKMLLEAGASWIAVHGRRREQKGHETGLADWHIIRYLRDELPPETVIFANGNILGNEDLERCLEVTRADGVMSAEGNLCDPGIFAGPEGREEGKKSGEYWIGSDGRKGGWRMDAVLRRYLDIIYTHVLEQTPPSRPPLFVPGKTENANGAAPSTPPSADTSATTVSQPVHPTVSVTLSDNNTTTTTQDEERPPPAKKPKRNPPEPKTKTRTKTKTTSPNLLAIRPHLFHFLRPLISTHTHIRDRLARSYAGDMQSYEEILRMIEDVTREGLVAYAANPERFNEENTIQTEEEEEGEEKEEATSASTIKKYKRPPWICQPYVRPLPKEALERGSLSLGKKARRKLEAEQDGRESGSSGVGGDGRGRREERDERDGVPAPEVAKEAMVCGRVLQQHLRARARTPLGLAPVGSAAVIRSGTAEVASTAAQSSGTLGIDNRATSLAVVGGLGSSSRRGWGFLGEGAIAEAGLAAGSAVDGLVLDLQ